MTDHDGLLHEANRRRGLVVEAARAFVWGTENGALFDIQAGYHEIKKSLDYLNEAEQRMQKEAG